MLFKKTIPKKYFVILFIVPILFAGIAYLIIHKPSINLMDSEVFEHTVSNDSLENGNSSCRIVEDSRGVTFFYTLRSDYEYPYASLGFQREDQSFIDINDYIIYLDLVSNREIKISFSILMYLDQISTFDDRNTFLPTIKRLALDSGLTHLSFPVASVSRIPVWWSTENSLGESNIRNYDYSKTYSFDFLSDYTAPRFVECGYAVSRFELVYNMKPYLRWFGIASLIFYALLGVAWILLYVKSSLILMPIRQTFVKEPVLTDPEKIKAYIAEKYVNPLLKMQDIATHMGISQRQAADTLKQDTGVSFKKYLNQVRMEEAKRLLKESDLQVSEIAYQVGYNSIQHFNRIFKEIEGQTPNDFRS